LIKSGALAAFFMPLYPLPTHRFGNLGFNVLVKLLSITALLLMSFDGIEIAICCRDSQFRIRALFESDV
jgi:hypothetical protein